MRKKKNVLLAGLLLVPMVLLGAGLSVNTPKLMLNEGTPSEPASVKEIEFHDGALKLKVPREITEVVVTGEDKAKLFNVDSADSEAYYLNRITGDQDIEVLCMFYFDSSKYLKYDSDAGEIQGIELAIIDNITSDEISWFDRILPLRIIREYDENGRSFDHYVGTYGSHKVEYVFTPVEGGLCVLVYIYAEEPAFVEDILYIMRSIEG